MAAGEFTDGYDRLSQAELVELLRAEDLEAAAKDQVIKAKDQAVKAKESELNKALKDKEELAAELQAHQRYIENSDTVLNNALIRISEIKAGGRRLIKTDYELQKGCCSYLARLLAEVSEHAAHDYYVTAVNFLKYSRTAAQNNSGKNSPQFMKAAVASTPKYKGISAPDAWTCQDVLYSSGQPSPAEPAADAAAEQEEEDGPAEAELIPDHQDLVSGVTLNADDSEADADGSSPEGGQEESAAAQDAAAVSKVLTGKEREDFIRQRMHGGARSTDSLMNCAAAAQHDFRAEREKAEQEAAAKGQPQRSDFTVDEELGFLSGIRKIKLLGVTRPAVPDSKEVKHFCSSCGKAALFKLRPYAKRENTHYHCTGLDSVGVVISDVCRGVCTCCGREEELSALDCAEREFIQSPQISSGAVPLHEAPDAEQTEFGEDIDQTLESASESAPASDKNNSQNNELEVEQSADSSIESSIGSKPAASLSAEQTAWNEGDCKQLISLLKFKEPHERSAVKLSRLLQLESVRSREVQELYRQAQPECLQQLSCGEKAELSMQLMLEGSRAFSHSLFFGSLAAEGGGDCFSEEAGKKLTKAERRQTEWRRRLLGAARKASPGATVLKCSTEESIIKLPDGREIINPCDHDVQANSSMPLFAECAAAIGLLIAVSGMNSGLSLPKARIHRLFADCGLDMQKQQVINWIIGFARAFLRPAALQIKHGLLHRCMAILMDETTLKVHMSPEYIAQHPACWIYTTAFCCLQAAAFSATSGLTSRPI